MSTIPSLSSSAFSVLDDAAGVVALRASLPGLVKGCINARSLSDAVSSPVPSVVASPGLPSGSLRGKLDRVSELAGRVWSQEVGRVSSALDIRRDLGRRARRLSRERSDFLRSYYGPGYPDVYSSYVVSTYYGPGYPDSVPTLLYETWDSDYLLRQVESAIDADASELSYTPAGWMLSRALGEVSAAVDAAGGLVGSLDLFRVDAVPSLSPRRSKVAVYADIVEVQSSKRGVAGPGGLRGDCKGFGSRSRSRLMRSLAKVRTEGMISYFITLTYPSVWSDDWKVWKRDLKVWRDRLVRHWPMVAGGVWRVEFQRRGAPHFHLILWCSSELPLEPFKTWLSQSWYEVVASGDTKHLRAGTQVRRLDGRRAIRIYVSKYVAKVPDGLQPDGWGRNWGFFGKESLDDSAYLEADVTDNEYVMLRRIIRRWVAARGSGEHFLDFLKKAETIAIYSLGVESIDFNGPPTIFRILSSACPGLSSELVSFLEG